MLNLNIHNLFSISEIFKSNVDDRRLYAHHHSVMNVDVQRKKKTLHGYSILYIKKVQ